MGNQKKSFAEETYQENFVQELKKYKWEAPDFLNGVKQRVTVNDLIDHWRSELNRINADQLEGVELTDNEFGQVMQKVSRINNSYEAAKLLAIEESTGKIDGIYRDKQPDVTRHQITLTIFKKAEVRGGDSSYRVAREVSTPKGNRFDIVLLINGLPLINIEQKRSDKTLEEAFGQFKRYYRDGEYCNNFMAFSQMMVINSEIETRYFATPKSEAEFNPSFVFHWADRNNHPINDWKQVVKHFLMIPMAHQMVGDYLVIDEAKDEENRRHMLMRPYQVYALQAVEGAAFGWDNEDRIPHGGFVWHTTGSGKTITSFKTALFLSTRAGFDKVVFLVDRRELDSRTSENFKAYAAYEPVSVDDTRSTYQLKKILGTKQNGIVVTTTFKLNSLVKDLQAVQDESLAEKRIVFIIDEAHRTTMGQMMGTIKEYFRKKGLFFGFTGTPLFDENHVKGKVNKQSELINTTEKLFGPLLHQYTIDQAIADKNVLGFHVEYINTGEFKSYDDLREKLVAEELEKHPEAKRVEIEHRVFAMSDLEVEQAGLFVYQDETHIPRVVERILDNWEFQSQNRQFNGILTVAYKNRVIAYYHEFKKQMQERDEHINIAMTFSFGNENENENDGATVSPLVMEEMFQDYGAFTGIEFSAGDKNHGEAYYFEDLVERATKGGSGRNPKNIDLVIVADQLLTGYDSKRLNTLYVDRSLELQGLIQAYSRTNRVFNKTKEFGTIVNFQYPKKTEETVKEALKLYGSGGENTMVIMPEYATAVKNFAATVPNIWSALPDPSEWKDIENDTEAKKQFLSAFKEACQTLNLLQQYYEFSWDENSFGMSEHEWLKYVGAYKNIKASEKIDDEPEETEFIVPLEGNIRLAGVQVINAEYILRLIGEKTTIENGMQIMDEETVRIIYEKIQELSSMGNDQQAQLLNRFVTEEVMEGNVPESVHIDEAFARWKENLIKKEVQEFAITWGIDENILQKSLQAYSPEEKTMIPYNTEILKSVDMMKVQIPVANMLLLNIELSKELPKWMGDIKAKYRL